MDEWQDTVFTSRHVHNRRGGTTSRGRAFEVRNTYGTYELKCVETQNCLESLNESQRKKFGRPLLEIYRLTSDGEGLIGEIQLPSLIQAAVILAGSRKTLQAIVDNMNSKLGMKSQRQTQMAEEQAGDEHADQESPPDDDSSAEKASDSGDPEVVRFETFEKNSFRSPKFWFHWRGKISVPSQLENGREAMGSGIGYIVFSGNKCRKFQGTISSDALGWDNVKISGWQGVSRSERDAVVEWLSI